MACQRPYVEPGQPVECIQLARTPQHDAMVKKYEVLMKKCLRRVWSSHTSSRSVRYVNLYSYLHNRLWREGWGLED